jgi:hypothetical protein
MIRTIINKLPGINANNQLVEIEKRYYAESATKVSILFLTTLIWKKLLFGIF